MNKGIRLGLAVAGAALCMVGLYIWGSEVMSRKRAATSHESAATVAPAGTASASGVPDAANSAPGSSSADASAAGAASAELATSKLEMKKLAESDEMGLL